MAYTNSPLVVYTNLSPNHSGQRTHSIDRITPHCVVGQLSAESICGCFISPSRQASCNYGIGKDGRVSLCVEEKNRSWCSSSAANDQRAITIECASDLTHPYAMNSAVYTSLIKEDDAMEIVVKQKRAAAYCRVSTGMECQEGSYEIQKSYFTELLSNNPDEELVKVYADEGSGRSTQGRPEFRQMIQDCMDGKIDIIYTKSISRFSRNMLDCVTVVRRLKELGIPVIFEKEGINTMNGQSELFFHILAIIAEEESKSIGENVRAGIAYLHDQGIPTGRVTYGFRRVNKQGEWRIEESEARRVRYAFDQAAKGVCYADIRACLDKMEDEENTGVSWSQNRNRLPNMLKNVAYMGDYWTDCYYTAYGKNGHRYSKRNRGERAQVHLEDHHEGIVSREQFERVQTMIQMGLLHSGRKKYNDEQQKVLNDPKWQ